jgi:hypothetical protein
LRTGKTVVWFRVKNWMKEVVNGTTERLMPMEVGPVK